jgi:hypothetical protein
MLAAYPTGVEVARDPRTMAALHDAGLAVRTPAGWLVTDAGAAEASERDILPLVSPKTARPKPAKVAKPKPAKEPAKRGRPIDPSIPRGRCWFRADEAEIAAWTAAAEALGVPIATWIRITCNGAVRK